MGKAVTGVGLALVVAAFVLAPTVWTQAQPVPGQPVEPRVRLLDGHGGAIGVRVRDGENEGVRIEDVDEESPAAKAGFKPGDIVVEFDGERVRSARHFSRLVQETAEGRTVKATVVRGASRQTLEVTPDSRARANDRELMLDLPDIRREVERGMRALPRDFAFDFHWDDGNLAGGWSRGRLGAQLTPLSDQLAEYFGAKEGVLVSSVAPDTAAARAGLRAGDVIVAVNGRPVTSPRDVSAGIRDADEGAEIELRVLRDRKEVALKAQVPERRPATRRLTRPA